MTDLPARLRELASWHVGMEWETPIDAAPLIAQAAGEIEALRSLAAWLSSDITGLSSQYLASLLFPCVQAKERYPHDEGDRERCRKFLAAVPEAAERLDTLTDARWDFLKATNPEARAS